MSANTDSFNNLFNSAILLHQNKKYDEALLAYTKILDQSQAQINPEQASTVSQNIAVVYQQLGNTNLAYVYNKKALTLNSRNTTAEQFNLTYLKNFKVTEITREISTTEQINNLGVKYIPYEAVLVTLIILFFVMLKAIFNFLIVRKKELIENKNLTGFNWFFYVNFGLFFCVLILFGFKTTELNQRTGIIRSNTAQIMTAAGANQAIITELNTGHVVQILQNKVIDGIDYSQIKVPGAVSGWIKRSDLEPLNFVN